MNTRKTYRVMTTAGERGWFTDKNDAIRRAKSLGWHGTEIKISTGWVENAQTGKVIWNRQNRDPLPHEL